VQSTFEVTEPLVDSPESSLQHRASSAVSRLSSESFENVEPPTTEEYAEFKESKPAESMLIPHTDEIAPRDKAVESVKPTEPTSVTTTFTSQVAKKMSLKEIEIPKESEFDVGGLIGEAEARVSSSPKTSANDPVSTIVPSNNLIVESEPRASFTITAEKVELQAPAPAVVSEKQPVPPSRSTLDLKRKKSTKSTKSKKSGRCTIL
jgi:hypothetical protein